MLRLWRWLVSHYPFGVRSRSDAQQEPPEEVFARVILEFRAEVKERLHCGIPFVLEEFLALGTDDVGEELRAIYQEEYVRYQRQLMALQGKFFVDALGTGWLGAGAVWDELEEEQQDKLRIQRQRVLSKINNPRRVS